MLDHQLEPAAPTALVRSLGVVGVLLLTLSVTSPVSSLFVIVPGMLRVAGTGAIWAVLLAGIVCVATAYVYAELSSVWPVAGGEYVMVARTLGPLAGFVMLGVNVFNNLLFPPAIGLGLAAILSTVIPGLPAVPLAVTVIIGSTLVALLQIRVNAWVTGIFLLIELVAVVLVVVLGFGEISRPFTEMLSNPTMLGATSSTLVPASAASIGLATSIAIFALNGYGAAVYFGEEMHEAPRKIAKAIFWAVALTLLLEGVPMSPFWLAPPISLRCSTAMIRSGCWSACALAMQRRAGYRSAWRRPSSTRSSPVSWPVRASFMGPRVTDAGGGRSTSY